ncbi:hypothetical protein VF21_01619 [Pseudogymnoascus sp. 05NY08]|nr:hypothetical protein VF21_01619 [Pseudogymnoascus sp. 05NY08]
MSSADPGASAAGDPAVPPDIFNPPPSFANFNYKSKLGFHYTEASFQRQFAVKHLKTEKYQQKEAFPRPDGVGQEDWKKCFNAADSWVYKRVGNCKVESLNNRQNTHFTRDKAEQKLRDKLIASGQTVPGPEPSLDQLPLPLPPPPPPPPPHPPVKSLSVNKSDKKRKRKQQPSPSSSGENYSNQAFEQPRSLLRRRNNRPDNAPQNNTRPLILRNIARPTRFKGSYSDHSDNDYEDADEQPSPPSSEVRSKTLPPHALFNPGAHNQAYRSDPSNRGTVYNNLYSGHRDSSNYTKYPASLGRVHNKHPAAPKNNSSGAPGPSSFTDNSNFGAQPPRSSPTRTDQAQGFGAPRVDDDSDPEDHYSAPKKKKICQTGASQIGTQQPRSNWSNPSPGFQAPRHNFSDQENFYSASPQNNRQIGSSQIGAQQPSSSWSNPSPGSQAPRANILGSYSSDLQIDHQLCAQQPRSSPTRTNQNRVFQTPNGDIFQQSSYSTPQNNSNFGAQQPPHTSTGTNPNQGSQAPSGGILQQRSYSTPQNNSSFGAQQPPPSRRTNPNQGSQEPKGSTSGGHSSTPQNTPDNAHEQPSSEDNSTVDTEKASSFKNDPKNAHGQSSSKAKSKNREQQPPSSGDDSDNELSSFKRNPKNNTPNLSPSKNDPKVAHKQSSSSSKLKTGAQQPSPLGSEISAQPPSRKAKINRSHENMSSQAKKQKGKADYCVCKQVRHGTKMIACEGGCENWFHVSCVTLECADTDGVAKFICDGCPGATTYKRVCRLEGCNRPHTTRETVGDDEVPKTVASKYCSLEHRNEFWARTVGGIDRLLASQLRSFMGQTPLGAFKTAGDQPTRAGLGAHHGGGGLRDGFVATGPPHNEEGMFSLDTNLRDRCHKNIARLTAAMVHYENRRKLVAMVVKYSEETTKKYAEENQIVESAPKRAKGKSGKGAAPTICGFDPRLSVSRQWISRFMATPEGDAAWESGVIGEHTNPDFHVDVSSEYYKGICVGTGGCHPQWLAIAVDEPRYNLIWISEDLEKENAELAEMFERVQLRLSIARERNQYALERAAEMTEENAAEFLRSWETLKGDKNIILRKLLKKFHPAHATS